jgi:hypothetical protein
MTMHDGNDADECIALYKDDRAWEPCQQLATHAELTRESNHGPTFRSRSLKRPHRRFDLMPELGAQTFTLALVPIDRVRNLIFGIRVNAD